MSTTTVKESEKTIEAAETYVTDEAEFEQMLGYLRAILAEKTCGADLQQEEFDVLKAFITANNILAVVNKILDDGCHEVRVCEANRDDELPLNLLMR